MRISDWSSDVCSSDLNLRELADGTVARREEARRAAKAARKEQAKKDKRRIKAIDKKLVELRKERDGLQEYLDELLVRNDPNQLGYAEGMDESQYQGLLEECDAAVEGACNEIISLEDERAILQRMKIVRAACRERVCQYVWI